MMRFKSLLWKLQYTFTKRSYADFLQDFEEYYTHHANEGVFYMCPYLKKWGCPGTLGHKLRLQATIAAKVTHEHFEDSTAKRLAPISIWMLDSMTGRSLALSYIDVHVPSQQLSTVERRKLFLQALRRNAYY